MIRVSAAWPGLLLLLSCLVAVPVLRVAAQVPRVRLMLAVPDAEAYERAMALVADGRLTALDGEGFLVVGDFADAREGYRLGRALQRRLGLPFELVYDPHHPQADLAWLQRPTIASQPQPRAAQLRPLQAGDSEPLLQEPLVYLYALPESEQQRRSLASLLARSAPGGGAVPPAPQAGAPVRVGVFRPTRAGRRLLAAQERRLAALSVPHRRLQLEASPLAATATARVSPSTALLPQPGQLGQR